MGSKFSEHDADLLLFASLISGSKQPLLKKITGNRLRTFG